MSAPAPRAPNAPTRRNLPAIAQGLMAGWSYAEIGRSIGVTGGAVRATAAKWLPGLLAVRTETAECTREVQG